MSITVYKAVDRGNLYNERTDRNIGWITKEEQTKLRTMTIGVAGNGGMGGLIAAVFLRVGIGEIRICDCEVFDASNINRQFGARYDTIGHSKATVTAEELRRICDDTKIVVDTRGITPESVEEFVRGCDLVYDEIEFFAVSARILLHQISRRHSVPVINCNTVGYGARLFLFTPTSQTMEELLGLTYEEALQLEKDAKDGSTEAHQQIITCIMQGLVPDLPEYAPGGQGTLYDRLRKGKAPIIGTNPPMATGFAADRGLLHLLQSFSTEERMGIVPLPCTPQYLYFDAARMEAKVVTGA